MRLIIAAVGRLKDGPERALFEKYRDRFEPLAKRLGLAPVAWHEIGESRAADAAKRRDEEGAALLKLVRDAEFRHCARRARQGSSPAKRSPRHWPRRATAAPRRPASSSADPTG